MQTFASIIDAFGGPVPFSQAVGVPDSHARTMKARDSIPIEYWQATIDAARERKLDGLTIEHMVDLAKAKAEARKRPVQEQAV